MTLTATCEINMIKEHSSKWLTTLTQVIQGLKQTSDAVDFYIKTEQSSFVLWLNWEMMSQRDILLCGQWIMKVLLQPQWFHWDVNTLSVQYKHNRKEKNAQTELNVDFMFLFLTFCGCGWEKKSFSTPFNPWGGCDSFSTADMKSHIYMKRWNRSRAECFTMSSFLWRKPESPPIHPPPPLLLPPPVPLRTSSSSSSS